MVDDYAHYDLELGGVVCSECQLRLMLAKEQLVIAGMKKCIQVSNGKPLPRVR